MFVFMLLITVSSVSAAVYPKQVEFAPSYLASVSAPGSGLSTLVGKVSNKTVSSQSYSSSYVFRNVFAYLRNSSGAIAHKTTELKGYDVSASATGGLFFGSSVYASHDAIVHEKGTINQYIIVAN